MQVQNGQMIVRKSASLPEPLQLQGAPLSDQWMLLKETAAELDRRVRSAEWHFFWLTRPASAWAIGRDREKTIEEAVRKAAAKIDPRYNAGEIVAIAEKNFLGLRYCKAEIAARHIQAGPILGMTETVGLISPVLIPKGRDFQEPARMAA